MTIKFTTWEKKPRTMLRYLKPGNIFCFVRRPGVYGFGRIMTDVNMGHMAEIFDYFSETPVITEQQVLDSKRAWGPLCLDSYALFDRKYKSDWRIIGHQDGYEPTDYEGVYLVYGSKGLQRRIDIFENETRVDDAEASRWPSYSPNGDYDVQEDLDVLGLP